MALAVFLAALVPAAAAAQSEGPAPVDPATVTTPSLDFTEDAAAAKEYDKYFYFWRAETDFAHAYADVTECDAFARGMAFNLGNGSDSNVYYIPTNLAEAVGAPLGAALGAALAKPMNRLMDRAMAAPKRRTAHRANLRVCMGYKGYHRYGLPKALWAQFNFDEAINPVDDATRQTMLLQQARIASGPQPTKSELK
jgi:hypothetical protein